MTRTQYKTKDLAEASMLIAKHMELLEVEREGSVCWFIFENETECKKIANDFWFGECLINGMTFYQAMRTLKIKIFSNK